MSKDKGISMILQTDKRLNEQINKYGCYFMSILFLANKYIGLQLSTTSIISVYNQSVKLGIMESNCFINDPDNIFKNLGMEAEYTQRHEPPKRRCKDNEIEILCLKYPTYNHFVVGDGKGNIAYNPMGKTADGYYLKSKRIFKI
jgi:hypothetical protein